MRRCMKRLYISFAYLFLGLAVLLGGIMYLGRDYVIAENGVTCGGDMNDVELLTTINESSCVELIMDGDRSVCDTAEVLKVITDMMNGYHEMPAFGVSLDNETRQAMKQGVWLELKFGEVKSHNGMPFESLVIEVAPNYGGFNIIRQTDGKYEGRCFYVSLDGDMSILYNYLTQKK